MKFLSVDRIENGYIICEDENRRVQILRAVNLLGDIQEGDVVKIMPGGGIAKDEAKTSARKEKIIRLKHDVQNSKL